jgi:hypothetical protein
MNEENNVKSRPAMKDLDRSQRRGRSGQSEPLHLGHYIQHVSGKHPDAMELAKLEATRKLGGLVPETILDRMIYGERTAAADEPTL